MDDETIAFSFFAEGAVDRLVIPPPAPSRRSDGLWRHTCFEAFLQNPDAPGYTEFNFAPSGEWAAYSFEAYREGMAALPVHGLACNAAMASKNGQGKLVARAVLMLADCPPLPFRIGLCAVIEARDGTKSYWALAHPPGAPDFHHPDCFALTLAAPEAP